ncbi:MAG: alkaline phosphatase family protein [Acidobacteria bacterium]|nr:alkaline phosphatase family protein [Acidobacteriota bacterium]
MKRVISAVLALVLLAATSQGTAQQVAPELKLILLISIDQMRFDYVTRFRSEFTAGFDRLLTQGAVFTDAQLEHYPTVTAVGHATMLTGATPAVSGIIGNDWYDRTTGTQVTSVSDKNHRTIGQAGNASASPHRLLVTTVGDELKAATSTFGAASSRVIGVSLKDRASVLMAGHNADAAYWYDQASGAFVSSTYYFSRPPTWVDAFNDRKGADRYAGAIWETLDGSAKRQLPESPGRRLYTAVYGSPFGNELLLGFAQEVITQAKLGQRDVTDLLGVSFSANDTVGHAYGPDSPEVHDVTVRADAIVGALLAYVDKAVGLEHTLVALTSDHGVAPLPEVLTARGREAGRQDPRLLPGTIQQALVDRFGEGQWNLSTAGSSPYLNYGLIAERGLKVADVRKVAAEAAERVPHVARVYTRDQLARGDVRGDRISQRVLRSFNTERSGDLEILLDQNWMRLAAGTTHGTAYDYDSHIPLILMGPGIRPGQYKDSVALNDLAPTLAALAGIKAPSGSSGRVLTEALLLAGRRD